MNKIQSTELRKTKICIECHLPRIIFSHGRCVSCARKHYPPIKKRREHSLMFSTPRPKKVIQDNKSLTQKEAFAVAYVRYGGRWFLTGEKVEITDLVAGNFSHVLAKGKYKWFKYYWRNIVLLKMAQHTVFDHGTKEQKEKRIASHPEENWIKLFDLVNELLVEYAEWTSTNPRTYKI